MGWTKPRSQLSTSAFGQSWPSWHSVGATIANVGRWFGSNSLAGRTSSAQKSLSVCGPDASW